MKCHECLSNNHYDHCQVCTWQKSPPLLLQSPRDHLKHLLAHEIGVKPEDISDQIISRIVTIVQTFFLDPEYEMKVNKLADEIDSELCMYQEKLDNIEEA